MTTTVVITTVLCLLLVTAIFLNELRLKRETLRAYDEWAEDSKSIVQAREHIYQVLAEYEVRGHATRTNIIDAIELHCEIRYK